MRRPWWYGFAGVIAGAAIFPMAAAWACLPVASLSTNPATAQPGQQVTVTGSEFGSNPVEVHFNSLTGPVLATFTPDSASFGSFSGPITVPASAATGPAVLVATEDATNGKGSSAGVPQRAVLEVVGPGGAPLAPAAPGAPARPVLPVVSSSTGAGALLLVGLGALGVALVVAAAVAMVGTRRPRTAPQVSGEK